MIEKYFKTYNYHDAVFDPSPSYRGDIPFVSINLINNSRIVDNKNLFEEFLNKNYNSKLESIFETKRICDIPIKFVIRPNKNNIGRSLYFSKIDFFLGLAGFLNQEVDKFGKSSNEHIAYLNNLLNKIKLGNDDLHAAFSNALHEKKQKLQDLINNELNSEYFDAAMKDYAPYKKQITFKEYLQNSYDITEKFANGILNLNGFFDNKIDTTEIYNAFDPDTFYLLFASIIYEHNLMIEKSTHHLDNSVSYLMNYKDFSQKCYQENNSYNPRIKYTYSYGQKIELSRRKITEDIDELLGRQKEIKSYRLPNVEDDVSKYKNIVLVEKLVELYNSDISLNWNFLPKGKRVLEATNKRVNFTKSEHDSFVEDRLMYMDASGYIASPIKGVNSFSGYYAFIYPNGKVILEKFWENELEQKPSKYEATYVMNIDSFLTNSKLSKTELIELMKNTDIDVRRIFHTSYKNWKKNVDKEINGTYRLEDAIKFIDSIKDGFSHEK